MRTGLPDADIPLSLSSYINSRDFMISRLLSPAGALLATAFLLISAQAATAQDTPVDVARRHFAALKSGNVDAYMDLMHPDELAKFKSMLAPAMAADTSGEGAKQLFDLNNSAEFMRLTDREVFARVLKKFVMDSPDFQETMTTMQVEPIGSVMEGTDMSHVVYRMKIRIYDEVDVTSMEVVSMRRFNNSWRMMLDKEMEGMGDMIVDMVKEMQEAKNEVEDAPMEEYEDNGNYDDSGNE